jgi:hypothetical protein
MKISVILLTSIVLILLNLQLSHAFRAIRSDIVDDQSLTSVTYISKTLNVSPPTSSASDGARLNLYSQMLTSASRNRSSSGVHSSLKSNSSARPDSDRIYADLEFKFYEKLGSDRLGYLMSKILLPSSSSISRAAFSASTKPPKPSFDNIRTSSAKTTIESSILFRQRDKIGDSDEYETIESSADSSTSNSSSRLGGDSSRGKALLSNASAAITILLADDEIIAHKRLTEKRLNKLIFQNLVKLFNDYKLYFFLLSLLFTLLIVFIVIMIFYSYMLNKSYSKVYKRSSKYLLRCRRTNNSFDIIDSGYKLNRSSFKPIDRERSNSALAISSLRSELAMKRASVAVCTGESSALFDAHHHHRHHACASLASGGASTVGVYVPAQLIATTTSSSSKKVTTNYGSVHAPIIIKHHGYMSDGVGDNNEEFIEDIDENEYGFGGGGDTLLKPKSMKKKSNAIDDENEKPDEKKKPNGSGPNGNNQNESNTRNESYMSETNFYELPYIDSTLLSTVNRHREKKNNNSNNSSNTGSAISGSSGGNLKFETFTAKRYETYKKSFNKTENESANAPGAATRNSCDEYTDVKYTSFNSNSTNTTNNNNNLYTTASSNNEEQLLQEYFARESNDNDYDNTHYEKKRVCSFLYDPPPSTAAACKYPSYVQKSSFEYLTSSLVINDGSSESAQETRRANGLKSFSANVNETNPNVL